MAVFVMFTAPFCVIRCKHVPGRVTSVLVPWISGSTIEGVKFVNPFEEDFDLNDWITIL